MILFRDMENAAKAVMLLIFSTALIKLDFADKRLGDVCTKQLHLCGKFLL